LFFGLWFIQLSGKVQFKNRAKLCPIEPNRAPFLTVHQASENTF